MFKNTSFKDLLYPTAVFAGGMIGVGFLSLPYLASQTNVWIVLGYFIVLTYLVSKINLMFAEVSLQTPDFKRLPGFARYHLGKWGEMVAMICTILGSFGVLLACLIVGSKFLYTIFNPILGGSLLVYVLLYVFVGGVVIASGLPLMKRIELFIVSLLILAVLVVFVEGFSNIQLSNIIAWNDFSVTDAILPFGPILFSLWGIGMIPEIEEMLIGKKENLKNIILVSTISVAIMYFLFVLLVLGISGLRTTESAFTGLKVFLGNGAVLLSLLVGALSTMTGFITQGVALKNMLAFDLRVKLWQAVVFTCLTPLILFLSGINSFVYLISVVGALFLGITGILILLMYRKIGGKNIIVYPIASILILGMIYQIVTFIQS